MSCLTAEQIDPFVRNVLDPATAAVLQAHLQECEACRRKVEQAREDERLLGKLRELPESAAKEPQGGSPAQGSTMPAGTPRVPQAPVFSSPPPDSFAGYQIIREVHRGGQGVVYQAVQKSTKRKVAIKVMKEGAFASRGDKARFEWEVEILGQLNHPNIVSVHDSGQAAGSFYFVMDYISGQPLDVWMAGGERTVEETLRLFQKICEAVHAAHLKGIIHRDLKPGNIRIDDAGEPYVLDFGLAKVAHGAEEASLMTMTGQFMGSLPWASPEQAEAKPGKIDMRTDVYSLGVVLCQMLTGKFPYDVVGNMRDVLDRIMKAEPARPSTFRAAPPRRVALAPRGQRTGGIPNRINDEVDTIVLKCLSKERERRYQSAGELARDIGHYLTGEPIEAKRDSVLYVLRKQLRRYKLPMAIAALFALVMMGGFVVSLTFWRRAVLEGSRAEQQRVVAEERRIAAVASEARAVGEAKRADHQAAIASSAYKFMNNMLAKANPMMPEGKPNATVREVMDRAASELQFGSEKYEPEVEAAIRTTIGQSYQAAGALVQAEPHLRAAVAIRQGLFADDQRDVAISMGNLASLLQALGALADAEPLYRQALAMDQRLFPGDHPEVASMLNNVAFCLQSYDRSSEALPRFEAALEMYERIFKGDHPDVARSLNNVAFCLDSLGRTQDAMPKYEAALEMTQRLFKGDHPAVADSLINLASCFESLGRSAEALPKYEAALEMYQRLFPGDHPAVYNGLEAAGCCLYSLGRPAEALPKASRINNIHDFARVRR